MFSNLPIVQNLVGEKPIITDDLYIENQIREIIEWENEEPSVVEKGLNKLMGWSSFTAKVIPEVIVQEAISRACDLGKMMTGKKDILREANVRSIEELQHKDLRLSDTLADSVHNWAIGIAGSEGLATGIGGTATIIADIGIVITLAFRSIHKIAMCYGYEVNTDAEKKFVLDILSVSSANTLRERKEALIALRSRIMQRKMMEEILMSSLIKKLAKQLGINLTKRKAMQLIPVVGAGIGAAVNASYMRDVIWSARRTYQKRWIADNGYILDSEIKLNN
ncbi:EcsC family protein [Megamonas hypermegale]|uniref:EcsC family protein n=1 Tax=Megamonas hypermegale TaxID=158847 RepID=UPI0026EC85D8|nr:EcsC family protein [Megamonas hypermegale]